MGWTELFVGLMIGATNIFDTPKRTTAFGVNKREQAVSSAKTCMKYSSPLKTYCEYMEIDPTCSKKAHEIEKDILNYYITKSGHVYEKDYEKYLEEDIKSVMKIIVYECQRKGEDPKFDMDRLPERLRAGDTALLLWAACFTRKVVAPSMMEYLGIEPFENGYYVKNNIVKENPNVSSIWVIVILLGLAALEYFNVTLIEFIADFNMPFLLIITLYIIAIISSIVTPIAVLVINPPDRYDRIKHIKYKRKQKKIRKIEEEKKALERENIRKEEIEKEQNGENKDISPLTDEFNYAIEYDKHKTEWNDDIK